MELRPVAAAVAGGCSTLGDGPKRSFYATCRFVTDDTSPGRTDGDARLRASPVSRLGYIALAIAFLFALIARGIAESFGVFLLPIQESLGASRGAVTGIYAMMTLAAGLAGPWSGAIHDRLGPRALYATGLGVLIAGCLGASWATAAWQLTLCLGVAVGVASACLGLAAQTPLIRLWFHRRMGTALGVIAGATGLGVLIFAPAAEMLTATIGWRDAYRVFAVVTAIAGLLLVVLPWRKLALGNPDAAMEADMSEPRGLRVALGDRRLWALFSAFLLAGAASYTIQPQLVAYFIDVGYEPVVAAVWLGLAGAAASFGMIGFGWIGDRFGWQRAIALSYVFTAFGLATLAAMRWAPAAWLLPIYALTFGASLGSRGPLVMALAARIWPGRALGRVVGLLLAGLGLGAGFGAWFGGVLHDASGGYGPVFAMSAGFLALSTLPWFALRHAQHRRLAAA
jgi:MFS family permease